MRHGERTHAVGIQKGVEGQGSQSEVMSVKDGPTCQTQKKESVIKTKKKGKNT